MPQHGWPTGFEWAVDLRMEHEPLPWEHRPLPPVMEEMVDQTKELEKRHRNREKARIASRMRQVGRWLTTEGKAKGTGKEPTKLEIAYWKWTNEEKRSRTMQRWAEEDRVLKKQRKEEQAQLLEHVLEELKTEEEEDEEDIVEVTRPSEREWLEWLPSP